jgi:hypothetical protein
MEITKSLSILVPLQETYDFVRSNSVTVRMMPIISDMKVLGQGMTAETLIEENKPNRLVFDAKGYAKAEFLFSSSGTNTLITIHIVSTKMGGGKMFSLPWMSNWIGMLLSFEEGYLSGMKKVA